jgi:Ni,Fe-hydrogenase maturation factor
VHSTCRSGATYCGDGYCDSGETNANCPADCVAGGGGTGGGGAISVPTKVFNFSVSTNMIKILVNQGETKTSSVTIINTGTEKLTLTTTLEGIEKYVLVDKTAFSLNVGESQIINLDFTASETLLPDVYLGKLTISGNGVEEIVRLIMEVKEVKPIFDVNVSVQDSSKRVDSGSFVFADIYMINLGKIEPTDVVLTYSLVDMDGTVFGSREETLAVIREQTVIRNLFLPFDAPSGDYIFYVKVAYDHQVATASGEVTHTQQFATASDLFKVIPGIQLTIGEWVLITSTFMVTIIVAFVILRKIGLFRKKKFATKVGNFKK